MCTIEQLVDMLAKNAVATTLNRSGMSMEWNVPGKYGPHGELLFFLIKKEHFALTVAVQFKPVVLAETHNVCALIGLHLLAAGCESGSSSSCGVFSPKLRGIPGLSGPRYSLWKDHVSCLGK